MLTPPVKPEAFRRARVTWADTIEAEPVRWAWQDGGEGRIPAGSLSLFAGREGTGKSSAAVWVAAAVTVGRLPGVLHGSPRSVLIAAVEDSWRHTLVPRLTAAGADLSRVGRFEVVTGDDDELTLSLPVDNALLESTITDHDIALVIVDPLMSAITGKIDTHKEREVRSALDPLASIADRTGAILLGIAHFNKGAGTDAAQLITGSGAFKNVPRSVFGFARDDTGDAATRVMTQVKNSLGRDDLPSLSYVIEPAEVPTKKGTAITGRFTFTGESDRSVSDLLRESRSDPDDREKTDALAEFLADLVADGPIPAREAEKQIREAFGGVGRSTLTAAKKRAGVRSHKAGMTGPWSWSRAEESREQSEHSSFSDVGTFGPFADPSQLCSICGGPLYEADLLAESTVCATCEQGVAS